TVIVTVDCAPEPRVPSVQETSTEACVQDPWDEVAETNATVAGSVSVTAAPWAASGPALVTDSWYVSVAPVDTGSGLAVPVIARSAVPRPGTGSELTSVVSVDTLWIGLGSTPRPVIVPEPSTVPAAVGT